MRNRRLEQLTTYSGFQIPKTVVTRYLKGDSPDINERKKAWSIDTLIKSIEKFNSDKLIRNNQWKEKLKSFATEGRTREQIFNEIQRESRAVKFFKDTDLSYGAALNEAIAQMKEQTPNDEELKKLESLGKRIDFTKWQYVDVVRDSAGNYISGGYMEYVGPDGMIYQVTFADSRVTGNYTKSALSVTKKERSI